MAAVQIAYPGYINSVVTASNGAIYIFASDVATTGATIKIWKSTDGGSSFSPLSSVTALTVMGEETDLTHVLVAADSLGYIHVLVDTNLANTYACAYAKLNTSNDSWSTWEYPDPVSSSSATGVSHRASIAIDSNNIPHILRIHAASSMGNSLGRVYYLNRVGGSWSTPTLVSVSTSETFSEPSLIVRGSNIVEAIYWDNGLATNCYRTCTSGVWGTETALDSNACGPGFHAILATSGGSVYRYTHERNSPAPYPALENAVAISGTDVYYASYFDSVLGPALDSDGARHVFYIDNTNRDVYHTANSGAGWTTPTLLQSSGATYFEKLYVEWAYYAEYQSNRINYLYATVTNLYFDYFSLSSSSPQTLSLTGGIASAGTISPCVFQVMIGQGVLPAGDVVIGDWVTQAGGTTNLYTVIDEAVPSDADYIRSPVHPTGQTYTLQMAPMDQPDTWENFEVIYRMGKDQAGAPRIDLTVSLLCGSTTIASWSHTDIASGWLEVVQTLTQAQFEAITDFTNLAVCFSATEVA